MTDGLRISADAEWGERYGYSRALVVGDRSVVSGTTDQTDDHLDDAAGQARAALSTIEKALNEAGFSLTDVVRTHMYVTDPADAEAVRRSTVRCSAAFVRLPRSSLCQACSTPSSRSRSKRKPFAATASVTSARR